MSYKLSMKQKHALVTIHVLAVVAWLGGAVAMVTLGLAMLKGNDGERLFYTLQNLMVIDKTMIHFTALAALGTGIVLSLFSQWGLVKYYWVVTKLVLTVALIIFGITCMGGWLSELFRMADAGRAAALHDPAFLNTCYVWLGGGAANIAALILMTAISYFKPFGKIKKTRHASAGRA